MCVERKDNLKQEKQNKLSKNDTNLIVFHSKETDNKMTRL